VSSEQITERSSVAQILHSYTARAVGLTKTPFYLALYKRENFNKFYALSVAVIS